MNSYGKRAKMRAARQKAWDEFAAMTEHFDLLVLMTLHDDPDTRYGAKRLRKFYRRFCKKYDEYKRRYLAGNESTVCGDRTDTYVLKEHLREIGFDYDAECAAILAEQEAEEIGDTK